MATAFLSRKPELQPDLLGAEPRRSPQFLPEGPDDLLFEGMPQVSALAERVKRHSHAMSGLATLLSDLRDVLSTATDKAPITVSPEATAQVSGAADFGAFDDAVFDISPNIEQVKRPVAVLAGDADFLFDEEKAEVSTPTLAMLAARAEANRGVRI